MLSDPTVNTELELLRASLARKALADSRQRAAAAVLLGVTETDVLAIQHLAWAGTLTPSQLSALLQLTSGGTTALIQRLARLDFISREPHPEDRRSSLLRLSARGERRAAELYAPLVGALDTAASALAPDERALISRFLAEVARIGETQAESLVKSAERERPQVPRVPVPGLWA
jgi:DNA-binding MarR family transcriptional regulator